jgi:murein DD-endopeptidase MepM/ murein hydrolase activator NlpD
MTRLALLLALLAVAAAGAAPPGYEAARADIAREGRAVVELVRARDAEALFSRFSPEAAARVPLSEVEKVLAQTFAKAALGRRTGESALPTAPARRLYVADHRWGSRTLALTVVFDASGAIAGIGLSPRRALPRDPRAGYRLRARLSLPFRGEWWVFWGGPTERQNYHVVAPDQRHAYDLVVWRSGGTHRGHGTRNADYWAWGRPVLAPADGVVVDAIDGVRDNLPQVEVENRGQPAGNHVVIDLGSGEYALLAHLRRGSVRVRPGQRVRAGDFVAVCGNSGNTSEPHLHFHVQDRKRLLGAARGLPIVFRGYTADGRKVARGTPVQGQFVRDS